MAVRTKREMPRSRATFDHDRVVRQQCTVVGVEGVNLDPVSAEVGREHPFAGRRRRDHMRVRFRLAQGVDARAIVLDKMVVGDQAAIGLRLARPTIEPLV